MISLTLTVFDVKLYGGTKSLLISTRSVMGGKNNFLGIAYIVVGGLCIVLGVFFTVAHLIKPRFVSSLTTSIALSLTCIENWVTTLIFRGTMIQSLLRPRPAAIQEDKDCNDIMYECKHRSLEYLPAHFGLQSFWSYIMNKLTACGCLLLKDRLLVMFHFFSIQRHPHLWPFRKFRNATVTAEE